MIKKKVLFIGFTGRIGPSLLEEYNLRYKNYYDIVIGINKTKPFGDYETVKINLSDLNGLTEIFSGFDVVVNLAANADEKDENFMNFVEPNLIGTYNVLEATKRAGVKRVVLASSVHAIRGYPLNGEMVKMNFAPKPLNYYGATKVFLEAMCHVYAHAYGLSCIAIRIGAYVSNDMRQKVCLTRDNFDYVISQRDLAQLIHKSIIAPDSLKYAVLAGSSNNSKKFMSLEETKKLVGYEPEDDGYEMCKPHVLGKKILRE